jgi:hypothetical protein
MKKIIFILLFIAILSSCYFWNASLDNVVRNIYLNKGLSIEMDADFDLFKKDDILIYGASYLGYEDSAGEYVNTGQYSFYFYTPADGMLTDWQSGHAPTALYTMPGGDTVYLVKESDPLIANGWKASDYIGEFVIYADVAAAKGDYGYYLNSAGDLKVYDLQAWVSDVKAFSEAGGDLIDVPAPAPLSLPALEGIVAVNSYLSDDGMQISGNLLAFHSYDVGGYKFTFFNITDPSSPVLITSPMTGDFGVAEAGANINFTLTGDRLYAYQNNEFGEKDTDTLQIWDVSELISSSNIAKYEDVELPGVKITDLQEMTIKISGNLIYALYLHNSSRDTEPNTFKVWDTTNLSNITAADFILNSGFHYSDVSFYAIDYKHSFTVEGDKIYVPSGNNIEILEYSDGTLTALEYAYVGVPLKGVYKFTGDPYLYALGYNSISVVSVKN